MQLLESKVMQVVFSFGSVVYMNVSIYEGATVAECLKMTSMDICGYIENKKYIAI